MPSPFPGMDPYLEHPARWRGVHQRLITFAATLLNERLPPHYVADIDERLYVVEPDRTIYPDVVITQPGPEAATHPQSGGGAAVAIAADPSILVRAFPVEVREPFIKILPVGDERRVITSIEVLSPSNKTPGSQGRELYLAKQADVLDSGTHLLEVDLLRRGAHAVAVPLDALAARAVWDYVVSLHRAGEGRSFEVWTFTVRQRLPRVKVPLADDDPEVILDLQAAFDRCYDEGAYARRLDYRQDPAIPLRPDDAEWADHFLRERGLRP
ncbi:MAG: DUF4058 family protein [Armatimonadetes bacterium]|nr:DUF4058 family protein [Armatimonadota bacterium]